MIKVTLQEIEHLAKISCIRIDSEEAKTIAREIEAVLEYASSLQLIAQKSVLQKNQDCVVCNVMRDDVVITDDYEALLNQAPDRDGNFFVVPKIIKQ